MRNVLVAVLLSVGVGVFAPALAVLPRVTRQSAADHSGNLPSSDPCQVGLPGNPLQPAAIKTACGALSPAPLGILVEPHHLEPAVFWRRAADFQTLQSQHVLLRI